jgi:hypothetical protein
MLQSKNTIDNFNNINLKKKPIVKLCTRCRWYKADTLSCDYIFPNIHSAWQNRVYKDLCGPYGKFYEE